MIRVETVGCGAALTKGAQEEHAVDAVYITVTRASRQRASLSARKRVTTQACQRLSLSRTNPATRVSVQACQGPSLSAPKRISAQARQRKHASHRRAKPSTPIHKGVNMRNGKNVTFAREAIMTASRSGRPSSRPPG